MRFATTIMASLVFSRRVPPPRRRWKANGPTTRRNVVVEVERCGTAYCGRVVQASEKAKAKARKGGTPNLLGTESLRPA